ncbi:MAG: Calx-beta domain-containing protein [Pirellulaceae bacterium]
MLATFYVDSTPGLGTFTPVGGDQAPVAGLTLGTDLFTTIGAAVTAAAGNAQTDTINVADGVYAEQVAAAEAGLIFLGNQFLSDGRDLARGTESIVTGVGNSGFTPFSVTASDVQIAGFTVEGATNTTNLGFGIVLGAGTAGSEVRNNVIQNNIVGLSLANNSASNQTVIERNLFRNNNQPGPLSGTGIYTDQFVGGSTLTNVLIDDNTFIGNNGPAVNLASTLPGSQSNVTVSDNTITNNGNGVLFFNTTNSTITRNTITGSVGSQVGVFDGSSGITITENFIENGQARGIRIADFGGGPNSNITITNNSIENNAGNGLEVGAGGYTGTLNAENNYWGSPTGPTTPENPGGTGDEIVAPAGQVDFSPFLVSGTDSQPGTPGFQPAAGTATGTTIQGTAGNDLLEIFAGPGSNNGFYQLNGGPLIPFVGITSFSFAGLAGNDIFRVNNPAGGLFAPVNGIFYDGGQPDGAPGDSLEILGGAHTRETHTFTPDGADGHNGLIGLLLGAITANYTYTGLEPVLVNAGTPTDVIFNLPTGDGNNQAILEDAPGANLSQIRSQNGTFETTVFVNPTNSLTVNYGNDGESVTVAQLDPAFAPLLPVDLNGGAGGDRLFVNFASGNNVIPPLGINFNGASGADGILLLPGYTASNVTYNYTNGSDGNINVDGRIINYTGQDSSIGIFDQLTAANRIFNFSAVADTLTVNTGFAANDGFSRMTSGGTALLTDFRNPTSNATFNLGAGNDTITVPGFDAVGAPPTATFNGLAGDDTFNMTASTTTASTVDGGEIGETATGDTLNYDAAGGVVTRTPPSGENGTITAPGFQPFTFANIENVNIVNGIATISINDVTLAEGNAGTTAFVFTVRLSTTSTQTIVVNFSTQDGTATVANADYVANAGAVTFVPGDTEETITVLVNGDTTLEPTENFFVNLTGASGGFTFADAQGTGTILNDDVTPTANINDVTLAEGNAGTTAFVFTVTLTNASTTPITIAFNTENGSATVADADYVPTTGVLTFVPGDTTETITVLVNGDTKFEPEENFLVRISNPTNATINDDLGFGTIVNDDTQPTISIADVSQAEGNGPGTTAFVFTVTLSNGSATPITVGFTTVNNTATVADLDYVANAGTLTFLNGDTTETITVLVNGDTKFETDEEFLVLLSNATGGATFTDANAVGTILNDDGRPTISINDVTLAEGNTGTTTFTFTLTLSNTSENVVTVNYAADNGSATVADLDYIFEAGVVTFAPGTTTQTITIDVVGDTKLESNEFFVVNLTVPTNAIIGDGQGQGNITNDDGQPSVSVSDAAAAEGDPVVFTFTLSNASDQPVTVRVNTTGGTATADVDYNNINSFVDVVFAPGTTTQTLAVPTFEDANDEPNETFQLNVLSAINATVADGLAIGTITDDDATPIVSINDVTLFEGNAGTTPFVFTISLTNPSSQAITVTYTTNDGTATVADADYLDNDGSVTFAPGQTSQTVTVLVNGDLKFEADETFTVTITGISPGGSAVGGDTSGLGTILNDSGQPSLTVSDATVEEGGNAVFTLTLSNPTAQDVVITYNTTSGTATGDVDYNQQNAPATITIPAGQTTATVTISTFEDLLDEPDETFFLNILSATNTLVSDGQGVGTITDDDATPTISITDATVLEGNVGSQIVTLTVTLTNPSSQAVVVTYTTADGTATAAGGDYVTTAGTLTFAPGQTSQTIDVLVNGDLTFEATESFFVNLLTATNAVIADPQGQITITNDDVQPTVSTSDATATEGSPAVFTLTLSNPSDQTVTARVNTNGLTATANVDYNNIDSFFDVVFAPGTTVQTVSIPTFEDNIDEPNETFQLNVISSTNATVADGQGIGTIVDNDAAPVITITDVTVAEGNAGTTSAVFTVTLSNPSSQPITVAYTTVDGTATAADDDYETTAGTLTFAPGQTSQTIAVPINGDTKFELNESFTVVLSAPTGGATFGDNTGVGTITNDDFQPTASITDVTLAEGNSGTTAFVFTVTLTNASATTVTMNFATQDGTATVALLDYLANAGTLTFAPGVTTQTITVLVNGDLKHEPNETFFVNLTTPSGTTFIDSQGQGTILNDDAIPAVSITDVTVTEGNAGTTAAVFTVTLANPSGQAITIFYTTNNGTATVADGDYVDNDGSIVFAPGETSNTITVLVNGDTKFEATETFTVTLTGGIPPGSFNIVDTIGMGAITNDDAQPTLTVADVAVAEGSPAVFTIILSNTTDQNVIVTYSTFNQSAIAPDDYATQAGTVTILAGQTTATVTVPTVDDNIDEPNETFLLVVTGATNVITSDGTANGIINDNDAAPAISINNATVTEGDAGSQTVTLTVTLSNPSSSTVTVNFATANGTATVADNDYETASGTLTFLPLQTTATINVTVNGDTQIEADENFFVNLSNPTNATIGDGQGEITIINDDFGVDVSVTKSGTPDTVIAGQNLTYTIVVSNNGVSDSLGVTLSDIIPVDTTFVSFVSPAGWTSTTPAVGGTGTVTSSIATLAAGSGDQTFTLIVRASAAAANGSTITNTATVDAVTADPDPSNNSASTFSTVDATADLSITKTGNSDFVSPGQQLTYTIVVSNNGVATAQNVTLTDVLPANTVFVSFVSPAGWTNTTPAVGGTGTVTSSNASLAAGASASFTLTVQVSATAPNGAIITNTASVETTSDETDVSNNSGTDTAEVTLSVLQDCNVTTLNAAGTPDTATLRADADNPGSNVIVVTGTSRNDVILIEPRPTDASQVRVKINGQLRGIFNNSTFSRFVAFGLGGNDKIIVGWHLEQDAKLFGGAGDDYLYGGAGKDGLDGGIGNDHLFGGLDNDVLCGAAGTDFLYGQQDNDVLGGGAGNDKLFGEGGNDQLQGGDGLDYLYGGIGDDLLFGQVGNDVLFGESGNDIAVGGAGNDHIYGGTGRDLLIGGTGDDTLYGESDDDILVANSTTHDTNQIALMAILLEWTSGNSYATRVNNIRSGGGGANGGFTLNSGTVIDDGRPDCLWGNGGQDWFLTGVTDKVKDKAANETVN